jgi:hypothetical protein
MLPKDSDSPIKHLPQANRARKAAVTALRWLAAGIIFWIIAHRISFDELMNLIHRLSWKWLPAALLLEAARIATAGATAHQILRAFGKSCSWLAVVRVNLQAAFFGVISDLLGAATRWGGMSQRLKLPIALSGAVMIVETLFVWMAAYGINWAFWPFAQSVWQNSEESRFYFLGLIGFGIFLILILAVIGAAALRKPVFKIPSLQELSQCVRSADPVSLLRAMAWILIQYCCSALFLVVLASAVDLDLNFGLAIWICGFANVVQSLPGAVFGWSLRVGVLVFLAPRIGGSAEQGALIGVFSSIISLTGVLAGAVDYVVLSASTASRKSEPS